MRDEVMGEAELPAVMKNLGVKVEESNMTIEEAVLALKRYQGYEPMEYGNILKHSFDLTDETVDTLLSAIRTEPAGEPLTLEQLREMGGQPYDG